MRKLPVLLIAIVGVALLLGVGIGVGAGFFMTPKPVDPNAKPVPAEIKPPDPALLHDLPEMTVTLDHEEVGGHFVRIDLTLDCADEKAVDAVLTYLPRLIEALHRYIQSQSVASLRGRPGLEAFEAGLAKAANAALGGPKVNHVLLRALNII